MSAPAPFDCGLRPPLRTSEGCLETAQLRKVHTLLDRLDLKSGEQAARDRVRLGNARQSRRQSAGARWLGLTLSTEQKAWAERKIAEQGLVRPDRDPAPGLSRHCRAIRRHCVRRDGRGGGPALVGRLSRLHRPQPEGRAARRATVHQHGCTRCSTATRETPTSSRPTSSPAACFSTSRSSRRCEADRGLDLARPRRLRRGLRRDPASLAATRYDAAVHEGRLLGDFGDDFHGLWRYYLMYCEGGFRGGAIDVAQVTLLRS